MTLLADTQAATIEPDPSRVLLKLFVPGREDVGGSGSRAGTVVDRIVALDEDDVEEALRAVDARFADRHRDLDETFRHHASFVTTRLDPSLPISEARARLLGAALTHEYAVEGAALCNPSAVPHPDAIAGGPNRFVLSVRGIGEGHRSSIGFRTGTVGGDGRVTVDPPGSHITSGTTAPGTSHRSVLGDRLRSLGDDRADAAFVLDALPPTFGDAELGSRIDDLTADIETRGDTATTVAHLRALAALAYDVTFGDETALAERVLWPHSAAERHGMEDARFVRFVDDEGARYYATYTAFDGVGVSQHLIETADFASFSVSPMTGDAANGKGLALFPRRVGGRFAALSRADRETNSVAFSDDVRCWHDAVAIQQPSRPWEIVQLGNCGSPIETEVGWLVLTHGVGPMRTYTMGALLLDLHDPTRVIARSQDPLVVPSPSQHGGYVPNVVYSCGAYAAGDVLVLPYGVNDQSIVVETRSVREVLASLRPAT